MYFTHLKIFRTLILFFFVLSFITINAQKAPFLKFHEDGKFKIVQFTDVHLKVENPQRCDSVLNMMRTILSNEKPDLVVLTGDVCTSEIVKEAWATVTKPMIEAKIPWAAVFGNHDHEHKFTNKQIMDYLMTLPYNLSQYGPPNISGSGNYVLEIKGAKSNKTKNLLYCFDSNAYTWDREDEELGKYGWIMFDQIQWYREKSKQYTKKNYNIPYPALAFFHIPLPEYSLIKGFKTTVGDRDEEVCSPKINSGMYNAMLESKDVMGTFCGHDHNNNYIGTLNNIALAYGCKTGKDSYGKNEKGGRVIVLYEGERKFDTWITTLAEPQKYFVTYPDSFKKEKQPKKK
jgi:3',5'-cyclic AMP phosphodiesterase CpdA